MVVTGIIVRPLRNDWCNSDWPHDKGICLSFEMSQSKEVSDFIKESPPNLEGNGENSSDIPRFSGQMFNSVSKSFGKKVKRYPVICSRWRQGNYITTRQAKLWSIV